MQHLPLDDDHLDIVGNATFDQLLDHNDPSKGTFPQRFWWNAEFYEEGYVKEKRITRAQSLTPSCPTHLAEKNGMLS